jgi:hypothetical protein
MTICGNCGTKTGPFDRIRLTRKSGPTIITCADGAQVKDGQGWPHGEGTLACLARRYKSDADRRGKR